MIQDIIKVKLISFFCRYEEYKCKYALGTLRISHALAMIEGIDIEIVPINTENVLQIREIKELFSGTTVIGIPIYQWTLSLAKIISRNVDNNSLIIYGGPSVGEMGLLCKNEIVIEGEGEYAWHTICEKLISKCGKWDKRWIVEQIQLMKLNMEKKEQLSDRPLFRGLDLYSKRAIERLKLEGMDNYFSWFETTRGCDFNCSFCGHKTRKKRVTFDRNKIQNEIKNLSRFEKVFIIDPELGGNKENGKWILKQFEKYAKRVGLIFYLRAELLDDEYIYILSKANISEVRIGIQTLNPNVSKSIRNNSIELMNTFLPRLSDIGISWLAELIIGLPGDNFEGLKDTLLRVEQYIRPTRIAAYHLTLIKGTPLYNSVVFNELEKCKNQKWIMVDEHSRAKKSYSYTYEELLAMKRYAKDFIERYNNLKRGKE